MSFNKPKYRPPPKLKIPAVFTAYLLKGVREIRDAVTKPLPAINRKISGEHRYDD
jgi:hypothetical protein